MSHVTVNLFLSCCVFPHAPSNGAEVEYSRFDGHSEPFYTYFIIYSSEQLYKVNVILMLKVRATLLRKDKLLDRVK